ncbi:hypothetical protein [Streptomyces sp. NPDC093097]|uniref:hypothetical protein n=1 Tax=Streptomyces sp. NPDC093097 TaxID=3366027 RepID=UPI003822D18F
MPRRHRQTATTAPQLTDQQLDVLHWAAVALALREIAERDGHLTAAKSATYGRYQQAAQAHGFTDADVRGYRDRLAAAA